MINYILDNIYLGDWQDAYYVNRKGEFNEIFTVAKDSPFIGNHFYGLVDGPYGLNYELMVSAINDLLLVSDKIRKDGTSKILVHCVSGFSRAPTIVAGYMINKYEITIEDSVYYMKKIRHLVNPNPELLRLLRIYKKEKKKV